MSHPSRLQFLRPPSLVPAIALCGVVAIVAAGGMIHAQTNAATSIQTNRGTAADLLR